MPTVLYSQLRLAQDDACTGRRHAPYKITTSGRCFFVVQSIVPDAAGRISSVPVKPGQTLRAGDVVALISSQ